MKSCINFVQKSQRPGKLLWGSGNARNIIRSMDMKDSILRSTLQLLLVAQNEHGVGEIAFSRWFAPAPCGSGSQAQAATVWSAQRLRAILQTPCSFSATRRSCGVDRSIESFVSIPLIRILAFPELQSNFSGRCDFWTKFVRIIVAVKQNKTILYC